MVKYDEMELEEMIIYNEFVKDCEDAVEEYEEYGWGDYGLSLKIQEIEEVYDMNYPQYAPFLHSAR